MIYENTNFENVYGCFLTQSHRIRIHVTSTTHIQSHNITKTNYFTSSDPHGGILDNCSDSKCATRQQEESSARMAITSAALHVLSPTFYLASILTFCLAFYLTFYLTFFLTYFLAYLLTHFLPSIQKYFLSIDLYIYIHILDMPF